LEGAVIRSLPSTALDSAEAVAANELHALLSGCPIDASRQALALATAHFKLASKRQRKPRRPTLASVSKQVSKAGIEVARYVVKSDSIDIVTGKPEPAAAENPWPLDEFQRKDIKQ
jgi:hypothetical protein